MEQGNKKELIGTLWALLATLGWGTTFVIAKYLVYGDSKCDVMTLVFFRYFVGAMLTFAWLKISGKKLGLGSGKNYFEAARIAFFLFFVMTILASYAQQSVSATTTAVLMESGPALLIVIWMIFRNMKIKFSEFVTVPIAVIGCMMLLDILTPSGFKITGDWFGQLLIIIGAVSWVIGSYYNKKAVEFCDAMAITAWSELFCALMSLVLMGIFYRHVQFPCTTSGWLALLYIGTLPTAVAFFAWGKALRLLPLWKSGLMQNMTPVFTIIFATLFMDEHPTWWNLLGIAIVIISLSTMTVLNNLHKKPITQKEDEA